MRGSTSTGEKVAVLASELRPALRSPSALLRILKRAKPHGISIVQPTLRV
jgi:hypothetical protein